MTAKALRDPAFTVVLTTAGGKDEVDAYRTEVLASPEAGAEPTFSTGEPTNHPTGEPTSHPSGPPTAHAQADTRPPRE
jgi:hypothetical protein